ncbi:MAG: hypothetical protein AABX02_03305 [archaeon]
MKLFMIVLLFPVFLLLGQTVQAQETTNPLAAFDNGNYVPGQIIVSFKENVSKETAQAILAKHSFTIESHQSCVTESTSGPGEEPTEKTTCEQVESWNESLHVAVVSVPEGQEKQYAQLLLEEEQIVYVEPNYIATTTGDEDIPDQTNPTGQQNQTSSPSNNGSFNLWNFSPILIAAGIIFLLIFGYAAFKKMKIFRP